ncbi:MAG: CAP domain-containing protein [Bacteroidales bacterium]|nr:CAP domain-containing protein [Bacteroidales bacterium]
MKKAFVLIFFLFLLLMNNLRAQGTYQELIHTYWTSDEISVCNTSDEGNTKAELILLCNLVRLYPKRFSEFVLPWFLETYNKKNGSDARSLEKELNKDNVLAVIRPDKQLDSIAKAFAELSAKKKWQGHIQFDNRYKPALNNFRLVAENLFYGPSDPMIILMELLIDEGVKDQGHRKNLLDASISHIGIAINNYPVYGNICVMSMAGMKRSATTD